MQCSFEENSMRNKPILMRNKHIPRHGFIKVLLLKITTPFPGCSNISWRWGSKIMCWKFENNKFHLIKKRKMLFQLIKRPLVQALEPFNMKLFFKKIEQQNWATWITNILRLQQQIAKAKCSLQVMECNMNDDQVYSKGSNEWIFYVTFVWNSNEIPAEVFLMEN